jgi:hypothetical protein
MKSQIRLTLVCSLLLTACGGLDATGGSSATASANASTITIATDGTATSSTAYTLTNPAGGKATSIDSATVTWGTGAGQSATVAVPAVSLPAGLTCAAAVANVDAACDYNAAGTTLGARSKTVTISDSTLFASVAAANPGAKNLPVSVKFNNTSAPVNFSVTVGVAAGGTEETAAPAPIILINNTGGAPYGNILSVTVSAGVAAGVGVKQLILEVTDAKGIIDTSTYTASSENATFNIDTTKFPDGALKLRAIAVDATDKRGTSTTTTAQIANSVAPTISITSPATGSAASGLTNVTVQIRQNNTAFTFTNTAVALEIIDSRGQLVTTQNAPIVPVNPGLWQASSSVDFNATQYLNGNYTIRARAVIKLGSEAATRDLLAVSNITNTSKVDLPPALNIILPAFYDANASKRPVLTRKSAIAIQVSDSDNINQIQLQFVCNPSEVLAGQACNTVAYNFNLPINAAGLFYRVFNTGVLIDAQPFIPDGYYVMRATATDAAGNSNIKEMRVEVNRSKSGIANLGQLFTTIQDDGKSKFTPTAATWAINGTTVNTTRVISLFYSGSQAQVLEVPSAVGIETQLPAGSAIGTTSVFVEAGTFRHSYLVQDLTTGVVEFYDGSAVVVAERN